MGSYGYDVLALLDERERVCKRLLELFESVDDYYAQALTQMEGLNEIYQRTTTLVEAIMKLREEILTKQKSIIQLHHYLLEIDSAINGQCEMLAEEIEDLEMEEAMLSPQLANALDTLKKLNDCF